MIGGDHQRGSDHNCACCSGQSHIHFVFQMHAVLLPLAVNQSYDFEDDRHTHSSLPGGGDATQHNKLQSTQSPRPSPRPLQSSHTPGANINKHSMIESSDHLLHNKDTNSGSAQFEGINTRTRIISREPAMISRENTGDNFKIHEFESKTGKTITFIACWSLISCFCAFLLVSYEPTKISFPGL